MRLGEIGLQRNGGAVVVRRFIEPPQRPQSVTEAIMSMSIHRTGRAGHRPREQLVGIFVPPALGRDDAQQTQRVGLMWLPAQHLAAEPLRPVALPCLVTGKRGLEVPHNLWILQRIAPTLMCRHAYLKLPWLALTL